MKISQRVLNTEFACSPQSVKALSEDTALRDGLPSVKKSPINQRFLRFRKKNGCVFVFPQSDDITGGLPQGTGFGEREIYILAKGYFLSKAVLLKELPV